MPGPAPIEQGGNHELVVRQGRTFRRTFYLRENDGVTPRPLTGFGGVCAVRDRPGGDVLLNVSVTVFQDANGPDAGRVDLYASAAATAEMRRDGRYELNLTRAADGEVMPFLAGPMRVDRSLTS